MDSFTPTAGTAGRVHTIGRLPQSGTLAERLRELLARLQREHAALKEASLALAGHMEGLMRQLSKRLSHAGTYGRTGMVESRVQVVSALDLRS